jgi:DNA-binding response OmpR family regulator
MDSTKRSDPHDGHDEQRTPHVLVVNDTKEILELFRELLEEEGFRVSLSSFTVNDIDEIVGLAPDLVILDFLMGGEQQGWQMLQKMKMSRRTATIPVIVCTAARTLVQEIEGHLLSKNVGIVLKPFDIDDLITEVHLRLKASIPQPTGPDTESPA